MDSSRRAVRNFEIDRTISHSKLAGGGVKRLTVAVVIDDRRSVAADGKEAREARSQEELDRYTALVKDAVGFAAERGDSINVINAAFAPTEPAPATTTTPVWEQSWLWQAVRLLLGAGALAAVLLGVLRPLLRSVRQAGAAVIAQAGPTASTALPAPAAELTTAPAQLAAPTPPKLPDLHEADPQRVMQVMRTWMAADA
jgi:flagellar M-ring protein FliF